jgi:glycosyltransferase involved in cell wall biosynthesis
MDIIFISMSSWDNEISSAALSLAKEFSKSHRVFYFDNPFTIKDFTVDFKHSKIKSRLKRFFSTEHRYQHLPHLGPSFYAVTPSLTLPINFLPPGSLYSFFLRINRHIVKRNLDSLLKRYQVRQYIFFNSFNPFYHGIVPSNSPVRLMVYQSRDDISQVNYGAKHGVTLEVEAIKASNISFATSLKLVRKLKGISHCNVHYLPNAVELESFPCQVEQVSKPEDLAEIGQDIVGYIGNLDQRIDYELLYQTILDHQDKTFVIIGPRNDSSYHNYSFDDLSNVVFIGPKPHNQLFRYLRYFSCTIIPFVKNTLTASIYPLKINEYLAMGKPVVTTDFSDDVLTFSSVCYLAKNGLSFSQLIDEGISQKHEDTLIQKRISFAHKNTWKDRVSSFWQIVNPLLNPT